MLNVTDSSTLVIVIIIFKINNYHIKNYKIIKYNKDKNIIITITFCYEILLLYYLYLLCYKAALKHSAPDKFSLFIIIFSSNN